MPGKNQQDAPQKTGEHPALDAGRLAVFDEHRRLLFSIAYRMLGSVADAEDMLQETFIRWQQASVNDVRSPKAFLVTVITRLCIHYLQSARVRREQYVGEWLPEPIVTDRSADPLRVLQLDESLSIAFLTLLERLAPIERAVFLLREVFEYDYSAIAAIVSQSEVNCRQILRRARQHMSEMRPRFEPSTEERDHLLEQFLQATKHGDMDGLLELLASDVTLHSDGGGRALAVPNVIHGAANVARGIIRGLEKLVPRNLVTRISQINGQPGIVSYLNGKPFSVLTLDSSAGRIRAVYVMTNPDKLSHLPNLPEAPS